MRILPTDFKSLGLTKAEEDLIREIRQTNEWGCLFLSANPASEKEVLADGTELDAKVHVWVRKDGMLLLRFFEEITDETDDLQEKYEDALWTLNGNLGKIKALKDPAGLKVPVRYLYIFTGLERPAAAMEDEELREFIESHCLFRDELDRVTKQLPASAAEYLACSDIAAAPERSEIDNDLLMEITRKLALPYADDIASTILGPGSSAESLKPEPGVPEDRLRLREGERLVNNLALTKGQLEAANQILKGEGLILACAGSGKTFVLLSKCFKAAKENPEKKFLITCYNRNLYFYISECIDRAGLRGKNVVCKTFHSLCRKLLEEDGDSVPSGQYDEWVQKVKQKIENGRLQNLYYGVFIDEVQLFKTDWYQICYDILEDREGHEHIFIVSGDMTQKVSWKPRSDIAYWDLAMNSVMFGDPKEPDEIWEAPWVAAARETASQRSCYPDFGAENKIIRMEQNYRSRAYIMYFTNQYMKHAWKYFRDAVAMAELSADEVRKQLDPKEFLLGKSALPGGKVKLMRSLSESGEYGRTGIVTDAVREILEKENIPGDQIGVLVYQNDIIARLMDAFKQAGIEARELGGTDWVPHHKWGDCVSIVPFGKMTGLDFRAVVVCRMENFGSIDTTDESIHELWHDGEDFRKKTITKWYLQNLKANLHQLYTACTRAKEVLYLIWPSNSSSVYAGLLENAAKDTQKYAARMREAKAKNSHSPDML